MSSMFKKVTLATVMAATAVTGLVASAAPAQAQEYHHGGGYRGGYRGGGDGAGAAIAGGILGLAVGAAIASDHDRGPYYEPYPPQAYYAPPPVYYQAPVEYQPYAYVVSPEWVWRDGYYWDRGGHRYFRDGRPFIEGYARGGYHSGYDRGWHGRR